MRDTNAAKNLQMSIEIDLPSREREICQDVVFGISTTLFQLFHVVSTSCDGKKGFRDRHLWLQEVSGLISLSRSTEHLRERRSNSTDRVLSWAINSQNTS